MRQSQCSKDVGGMVCAIIHWLVPFSPVKWRAAGAWVGGKRALRGWRPAADGAAGSAWIFVRSGNRTVHCHSWRTVLCAGRSMPATAQPS